jgi:nucleoside-diphosphate-sugar epimerase
VTDEFWKSKRVVVTGGAGFIGSYLVEQLVERGARVSVADNFETGRRSNLDRVSKEVQVIEGDLRDPDFCSKACARQEVVLHLASKAFGLSYSNTHHGEMLADNLMINTQVLEACRRADVPRVLVTSSSCVYPDDATVPTPETQDIESSGPEKANEGYGWGKRMLERQAAYYHREYNMQIAIARPFNTYGPRHRYDPARAHVLPALVMRVLKGEDPITVWGSGNQTRSFVHASDMASGLRLVAEKYPCADPVNIGHSEETRLKDLLALILEMTGQRREVVFDLAKPEGALRKSCDPTKLRQITGFAPSVTLRDGLPATIEHYRQELLGDRLSP